jgi:hypothetical protein
MCPSIAAARAGAAVLSLLLLGLSSSARADGAKLPISDEARAKFSAGVALLTDPEGPRYEEAYRAFKAAYASSPSPKILGNLGLCAMKLERDDEAIAAYEKYLTEMGKDLPPDDAKQIKSDLATLKASVAHIMVESDPPGAEIFDARVPVRGDRILNSYGVLSQPTKLGLRQGTHQLTVRLSGQPDQTWDVEVIGGQDLPPHKFVFKTEATSPSPAVPVSPAPTQPPPPPPPVMSRPIPTSVWIGAGVTGALTVATVATSVLAMANHNDYENALHQGNTSQESSLKDSGNTKNLIADVCLGGAVVGAVVTGVLYLTRPAVAMSTESDKTGTTLRIVPEVGTSSASIGLRGSF